MSAEPRLLADLEVLRTALAAYLDSLRALWASPEAPTGASADVARIMGAVGAVPEPTGPERAAVRTALAAAAADRAGVLGRLAATFLLSPPEELTVAAAWWAEADPQFAIALGCAHDDGARRYPSAALLRLVLAPFGLVAPPALDDDAPLVRFGLLEPGAAASGPLRLTPTARLVLAGEAPRPLPTDGPVLDRLARTRDALVRHLRGHGSAVLLRGPEGIGRRALAAAAAAEAGLVPVEPDRPAAELRLLARLGVGVPVIPVELLPELGWRPDDGPLIAWSPPNQRLKGAYVVDLPPPTHEERVRRWRSALRGAGLPAAGIEELAEAVAARFAFTEGDVDAAVERALVDAAWTGAELDAPLVWEAARRQPEHALERLAALVTPAFTLDDLVLPKETHAKLGEIVAHVSLQHVVLDGWGFRRRLPRGQGVAALFGGPPGTGKTMAAEAIAHTLRQDLYRVDLSAVVSKYIGETEKNLAAAFDEAERGSAVLFFDEADSLFGKRTEVRDAHDRYANLEVNYLLQRVESFTGLAILATNKQSAVDEAFLRRLRFVVRFELPTTELRQELWRRSFPPEATLAELDWPALAAAELAGGSIQSAALSAAYLAARNGGVIGPTHVRHALRREYEKLGKAWPELLEEARA